MVGFAGDASDVIDCLENTPTKSLPTSGGLAVGNTAVMTDCLEHSHDCRDGFLHGSGRTNEGV